MKTKASYICFMLKRSLLLSIVAACTLMILSSIAFRLELIFTFTPLFNHMDISRTSTAIGLKPAPKAKPAEVLVGYCRVHNFSVSIHGLDKIECVRTIVDPDPIVCIYPGAVDAVISQSIRKHGVWEKPISDHIIGTLRKYPNAAFIDIGANIGFHSLRAAKLGRGVLAVEPMRSNVLHLHKSVARNNVSASFTLVENAISDGRGDVTLFNAWRNLGGNTLDKSLSPGRLRQERIQTIFMDDLLEVISFSEAVLKIDIEGSEHKALARAHTLLDRIAIPAIYMEWLNMKRYLSNTARYEHDVSIIFQMLNLMMYHEYKPYSFIESQIELNQSNISIWPNDILWRKDT